MKGGLLLTDTRRLCEVPQKGEGSLSLSPNNPVRSPHNLNSHFPPMNSFTTTAPSRLLPSIKATPPLCSSDLSAARHSFHVPNDNSSAIPEPTHVCRLNNQPFYFEGWHLGVNLQGHRAVHADPDPAHWSSSLTRFSVPQRGQLSPWGSTYFTSIIPALPSGPDVRVI